MDLITVIQNVKIKEEKTNLIITVIMCTLVTSESGDIFLQSWIRMTLLTFHVIFGSFAKNTNYSKKLIC